MNCIKIDYSIHSHVAKAKPFNGIDKGERVRGRRDRSEAAGSESGVHILSRLSTLPHSTCLFL